nr:reverse transcriptase domain-containing protein [Tanacetum cinerariifolium]
MNTASSSGTGSLPSNTVPNHREDLKVITTRSGVTLAGPSVSPSSSSKEVDREPETITDQKLPKKLRDPDKFLIPCDFPESDECLALADLGASINLIPLSIWKKFSLPELTSTQMILELADRSTTRPAGIVEDIFVKVGNFHFPTDFIVVDYVIDPRVPLILGRPFLRTGQIEACLTSESIPLGIDDTDLDLEGDIRLLEEMLNNDPSLSPLPPKELNVKEIKIVKYSIDEPLELELKYLPSHLEYAYLEGTDKLPVIITKDLKDDEKEALLKDDFKPTVQSQRRVNLKIHEVIKKEVIKLLDAGMIYPISDSPWVSPIYCVPKKGGITVVENENSELIPTRLVIGQRKTKHFQPIHYASKTMTEAQLHYTMTEKEMLAVVYAFEKFQPYLILSKSIVYTDHSDLKYLLNKQDAKPRLIRWVLLQEEFDIIIRDKKGTENLAADHLSRLENPHKDVFENKDINEKFL